MQTSSQYPSPSLPASQPSHWLYLPDPRSPQPDSTPLPCHLVVRSQTAPSWQTSDKHEQPKQLQIVYSSHDLFDTNTTYQVPLNGNQSYSTTLIYFSTFSWHQINAVYNGISTSYHTHAHLPTTQIYPYPLNPISSTDNKRRPKSNPLPNFSSRDQSRRLTPLITFALLIHNS